MLHLHKASAGSGKTYSLTRNYIRFMIGVKREDGSYRLRTPAEIIEAHGHILAVTFTNKATNEMKQRFVDKLAALASDAPEEKIDYMRDFMREFDCPASEIRYTASLALTEILNNYTDFQVSTIDSFFQTILRSFAYESDLADNYRLEIDSDFMTRLGVDTALSRIRDGKAGEETSWWVRRIMKKIAAQGNRWNILQKEGAAKEGVIKFVSQIDKDQFRRLNEEFDAYFEAVPDFRRTMEINAREAERRVAEKLEEVKGKMQTFIEKCTESGADAEFTANFIKQTEKVRAAGMEDIRVLDFSTRYDGSGKSLPFKKKACERLEASGSLDTLLSMLSDFYSEAYGVVVLAAMKEIFFDAVPYIGLIREVLRQIALMREDNNIVQLSDTNTMLRKIISDDDTPFVYEKIGYYINHYLIDEFQDTSAMQWDNFRPLLTESLSRGNDNLIIGDAKQSIYRFRDADSSLITSVVPAQFPNVPHGESKEENTNHRSSGTVVRFNNTLFSYMAAELASSGVAGYLPDLYSTAIQYPRKYDMPGYVEVAIEDRDSVQEDGENSGGGYQDVAQRVAQLVRRGFRMGDIAVLVRTRKEGNGVIDAFVEYNGSLPPGETPIEFMSEESLKIVRAKSVNIIVSALRLAVTGMNPVKTRSADGRRTDTGADSFNCDFNWYAAENPDTDAAGILEKYFADGIHTTSVEDMISSMQSVALPALVENIAAIFLSPALREAEAPYIAAFQDCVLDYCENSTADPASFLRWWEMNGESATVSTPEGTDAVNVMTVHKSKGLEFRCVILPGIDFRIEPVEKGEFVEKVWVRPVAPFDDLLPPFLPLPVTSALLDTPYAELYTNLRTAMLADAMNSFYVACTRAIDELYISMPASASAAKLSSLVREALPMLADYSAAYPEVGKRDWLIDSASMTADEENMFFTYGTPVANPRPESEKEPSGGEVIGGYYVNADLSMLKYKEADTTVYDEEEDPDPRSDGNILHALMSALTVRPRLERELRNVILRMEMRGYIMRDAADKIYKEILEAVSLPEVERWFAPQLKVYNERPLVRKNAMFRPDRFMVSPEGDVTVVDYKFGQTEKPAYIRQVARYMDIIRRAGKYRSVKGFIWYVGLRKIVPVAVP